MKLISPLSHLTFALFFFMAHTSLAQNQKSLPDAEDVKQNITDQKDTSSSLSTRRSSYMNRPDSVYLPLSAYRQPNQLIVKDNIALASPNLIRSPIEIEISELEALECKAILKRDTMVLKKLWARDFTLDAPLNKVIESKNTLPYYVSYKRIIENLNVIGDAVYSRGYEMVQHLKVNGKLEDPVKKSYFHVWKKQNGSWRLVSKHR
jgi:hypothetical protein